MAETPSRLRLALADVEADVAARVAGVTFFLGARHVAAHGGPPRVVWVRTKDAYDAPDPGAALDAVRTRATGVVAHCWGRDDAHAEALVDAVVAALADHLGTSLLSLAGDWLETGHVDKGAVCNLAFTVAQPVARAAAPTTTLDSTAFDPTGAAAGDPILQAGEG